jgi:hypothetical protein
MRIVVGFWKVPPVASYNFVHVGVFGVIPRTIEKIYVSKEKYWR